MTAVGSVQDFVACDFGEYLADWLDLDAGQRPTCGDWSRMGSTIGALALRLSLMSEADVDKVLEIQDTEGGFFGEVAVRCGFLTPQQVSRLLGIQRLHDDLNLGEQLVVAGKLDVPSLLSVMVQFLRASDGPPVPAE